MPSLHPVDVAIVIAYLVAVIASGVWLSRRAAQGFDSYFLGGRNIPWYALGVSNASGMFDASGTMAMVAWMFVYGVKSVWFPMVWPTFNQIFMMVFLAVWLRRSGARTGADWLKTRFGAGRGFELAYLSVILFAVVTVVAFISYAFVGVGKFAALILPWDYPPNTYALWLVAATALYATLGGMPSVVLTDVVQFILLTVASIGVAAVALANTSAAEIAAVTPDSWGSMGFSWRLQLDWSQHRAGINEAIANDVYVLFTPFLMMAFCNGVVKSVAGPLPGYDMQRILAARDQREASLMSAIVSPVLFLPRYLLITGIVVLALVHYQPGAGVGEALLDLEGVLPYVITSFLPVGLTGIVLAGLLAAFMSTFDSNLNAGAAYLVNDFYLRYLRPQASQRELTVASYLASVLVVGSGVLIGLQASSINDSIQWIAGGLFGGYAAPNLLKWVWWRLNSAGYVAGMACGIAAALPLYDQSFFVVAPATLAAGAAGSILVSLATIPDDENVLRGFYQQVNPWGFWGPIRDHVVRENPDFRPNRRFAGDMQACAVGIIWQLALCALPVFVVLRNWPAAMAAAVTVLATSWALKRLWYDALPAPASAPRQTTNS